eukprot:TRINITY_DN178_c0_g1_i5.p1 TRINITY_DN178_c0_g1~~TRINITY_DN178_c0_g1_i5.p1  ORF type:complete len:423 (+),score=118.00 TRINITY_DN178_c0_g1_i5:202-1470(+)
MSGSWINYDAECDFPIENLPFGVFHVAGEAAETARPGVAIGDQVLDLKALYAAGAFSSISEITEGVFGKPRLNKYMSLGRPVWKKVREVLVGILTKGSKYETDESFKSTCLFPLSKITNLIPARIGDYTDFYSSREHATNLGKMFRPNEAPLKPNWVWLPVGYHGRASSVVVSGTPIRRPSGQVKPRTETVPTFQRSAKVDFELEMAFFVGPGNELGEPISMENAEDNIFGVVVMNDWSARDIQPWEYVPLGPFTAKNFATTISPWIVTLEALEPFRVSNPTKDPANLKYLVDDGPSNYDVNLEVHVKPEGKEASKYCSSNMKYLYWSMKQQLVHHSVTGCNMRPGDLLGSGTISGPDFQYGSAIEASANGAKKVSLEGGDERAFIEDGDTVILKGFSQGDGFRVGFGPCDGLVLPAHPISE